MKKFNKFISLICCLCIILPLLSSCKDVTSDVGGDKTASQNVSVTSDKIIDENAQQGTETTSRDITTADTTTADTSKADTTPEKPETYIHTHYAKMISDDIEDAVVWKIPQNGEDAVISVVDRTSGKEVWSEAMKLDYAREWGYYFCERTDESRRNSLLVWTLHFSKSSCTGTFKYTWFYVHADGTLNKIEEKSMNLDMKSDMHIKACTNSYNSVRLGLEARIESSSDWKIHLLMRWDGSELVYSTEDNLKPADGYSYTIEDVVKKSQAIVSQYVPPQTTLPDPSKDDDPHIKKIYADLIGDTDEELIRIKLPEEGGKTVEFAVYDMESYKEKWGTFLAAQSYSTIDYGYFLRVDKSGQGKNEMLEYQFSLPNNGGTTVKIYFRTFTLSPIEDRISAELVDEAKVVIVFGSAENIAKNRENFTEALEKLNSYLDSNESYDVYTIVRWDGEKITYSDEDNMLKAEKLKHTFESLKALLTKKAQ